MLCFDDGQPSTSVLIESRPAEGVVVHVLEVKVPELPRLVGAGVRIVSQRQDGTIGVSLTGKLRPEDDDGA